MSEPTPPSPASSDRNLLFGILALQMDFVTRDQLVAAMHAWVLDKAEPLGQILLEQGALSDADRAALDALVDRHLARHGGNPKHSLASVGAAGPVRDELRRLADPDLDASLAHIGVAPAPPGLDGAGPGPSTVDHVGDDDAPLCCPARYRVLRPHAKGGLGEVFVAEDRELHREVALKEIQKPHAHDPHSRSRFLLEAEVNGRLEHPGVVPVYSLGSYRDGRPFYAMRLIRGESLKEAIQRFHAADVPRWDPGERGLALRQLLGQFVAVCNVVAYAHSRGVLHRDIKPANVMLGKFGETLVVDWGLAKVVGRPEGEAAGEEATLRPSSGDSQATVAGTAIGTPAYMSPEQATGRLDLIGPASDIYSLGATLYALLTGQAPFRGNDQGELLRCVSRGEWVPPGRVKKGVPAALDAVCRKAMALRPQDRYATAQALAADVEHWLADEPVTAYREPLRRRLGRWRRRHPGLAAAAAVLLLAVAGFGAWFKLERDAVKRDVVAALTEVGRAQDQGKWAEARASLERARGRLADGGPDELRRRVRQAAADLEMVAELEELRLRPLKDEEEPLRTAGTDAAYAAVFLRYGVEATTADLREAAARIAASAIREQLVVALDHWASVKPPGDVGGRARLLSLARLADTDEWRQRLRDPAVCQDRRALRLLAEAPGATAQPPTTALILANHLRRAVDWAGAGEVLRRAQQHQPGDFWLNYQLGAFLEFEGPALKDRARGNEALGFYRAAVAARPQSPAPHVALGQALWRRGRAGEAEAAFREALKRNAGYPEAHEALARFLEGRGRKAEAEAAYREALKRKADDAEAHYAFARFLERQGRKAEAEASFHQAVRLKPDSSLAHEALARFLEGQGRKAEAEAAFHQAVRVWPDGLSARAALARFLERQGRSEETEAAYREAVRRHPDSPRGHQGLARFLESRGRTEAAEAGYREATRIRPDDPQAHVVLSCFLARQGRGDEAVGAFRAALRISPDDPQGHSNLGLLLWRQGRPREAEAAFREAARLGADDPWTQYDLGNFLDRQERASDAAAAFRRAVRLTLGPRQPSRFTLPATKVPSVGRLLEGQGRKQEAEAAYRSATRLRPHDPWAHADLGRFLARQGRGEEASAAYRQAAKFRPDDPQVHHDLARSLEKQGRSEEAEAAYREAARLGPDDSQTQSALARFLVKQGREAEAAALPREAVRLRPDGPRAQISLGAALAKEGRRKEAEAAFREAVRLGPDDPSTHRHLADFLAREGRAKEAEAAYREAVRLRPGDRFAQYTLGLFLERQGRAKDAEAIYREVIQLRPDDPLAHTALGTALSGQGRRKEAEAAFREAVRLGPDNPLLHERLADFLAREGRRKEASASYRDAARLRPDDPRAQINLGAALAKEGRRKEAEASYREAVRVGPGDPFAHHALARFLEAQGQWQDAEASFHQAVTLNDNYPEAHVNLGLLLQRQGRFTEALAALKRGHELGSKAARWPHASAQWVRQAEALVALDHKLPALLKGEAEPDSAAERIALAQLCLQYKRLYRTSARFYADAFAVQRQLADDPTIPHRYNAACAAALAAAGKGADAPKLTAEERTRLRQQALDWLRAGLTAWAKQADKGTPAARAAVQKTLHHWLADADLAGVRDPAALGKLPEAERTAWERLWADVQGVLGKAGGNGSKGSKGVPGE